MYFPLETLIYQEWNMWTGRLVSFRVWLEGGRWI